MRIVRIALKMCVNHLRKIIDNSTMEDARNMAILGVLLLIAVIGERFGRFSLGPRLEVDRRNGR